MYARDCKTKDQLCADLARNIDLICAISGCLVLDVKTFKGTFIITSFALKNRGQTSKFAVIRVGFNRVSIDAMFNSK